MKATIFGSGCFGLVTGACLAQAGNHVVCVDVAEEKISRLNQGELPIHGPGLETPVAASTGFFYSAVGRGTDVSPAEGSA